MMQSYGAISVLENQVTTETLRSDAGGIGGGQTRKLKSNHGRVNLTRQWALSGPEREVVRRGVKPHFVELA